MKQSSIEWLIRELDLDNASPTMKAINHARAMHKEEIENAVKYGCSDWGSAKDAEHYYNETFNTK